VPTNGVDSGLAIAYSRGMDNTTAPNAIGMAYVRRFHVGRFGSIEEWRDYGHGWVWHSTFTLVT
jgi:hypothetical protein